MEALKLPFEKEKNEQFVCDPDAIRYMAQRSDGYPYFVQMWGKRAEVHARMHRGGKVDMETVLAVEARVVELRDELYQKRWNELRRGNYCTPCLRWPHLC